MLSHYVFFLHEYQDRMPASQQKSALPLWHAVFRDWNDWNTSALLPEEAYKDPHYTNCSSERSSHLGIWKNSLEILLSHFHILSLGHGTGTTNDTQKWKDPAHLHCWHCNTDKQRYCELHVIPQVLNHSFPIMTTKMGLIHHTIPRPIHGRHNLICMSHPNTEGQWDERKVWDGESQINISMPNTNTSVYLKFHLQHHTHYR